MQIAFAAKDFLKVFQYRRKSIGAEVEKFFYLVYT